MKEIYVNGKEISIVFRTKGRNADAFILSNDCLQIRRNNVWSDVAHKKSNSQCISLSRKLIKLLVYEEN